MEPKGVQFTNTAAKLLPQEQNGGYAEPVLKKVSVNYCLYVRKSSLVMKMIIIQVRARRRSSSIRNELL